MEMGVGCGFIVGWMEVWGIWVCGVTVFTFEYKLFIKAFLDSCRAVLGMCTGSIPLCWRTSLRIEIYSSFFFRPLLSAFDTVLAVSINLFRLASIIG